MKNKTVVVVQQYIPYYRVAFFEGLIDFLKSYNISLIVAVSEPLGNTRHRADSVFPAWSRFYKARPIRVGSRYIRIGTARNIWRDADAVIVPDYGSSLDTNLACLRIFGPKAVGIWGHIGSYVNNTIFLDKLIERWQLRRSTHVFAYVDSGAVEAERNGVPRENITTVMNTIDTRAIRDEISKKGDKSEAQFNKNYGISKEKTFAYIGGLDTFKRIPFLCAVLDRLWEMDSEIKIIICGEGVDAGLLNKSVDRGQAIMLGYADATIKADLYYSVCALLMPGAIGLVAVDALVLGVPIITTNILNHGPEAEYLVEGVSKITAEDNVIDYSDKIIDYSKSCHERGYWDCPSLEDMIKKFGSGVLKLLSYS